MCWCVYVWVLLYVGDVMCGCVGFVMCACVCVRAWMYVCMWGFCNVCVCVEGGEGL